MPLQGYTAIGTAPDISCPFLMASRMPDDDTSTGWICICLISASAYSFFKCRIFGIDGLDDALEAVRLGTMQGTVYNDREAQARKIALIAVALFRGNDVSVLGLEDERYYMAQYRKVDVNNVDEFLKK